MQQILLFALLAFGGTVVWTFLERAVPYPREKPLPLVVTLPIRVICLFGGIVITHIGIREGWHVLVVGLLLGLWGALAFAIEGMARRRLKTPSSSGRKGDMPR